MTSAAIVRISASDIFQPSGSGSSVGRFIDKYYMYLLGFFYAVLGQIHRMFFFFESISANESNAFCACSNGSFVFPIARGFVRSQRLVAVLPSCNFEGIRRGRLGLVFVDICPNGSSRISDGNTRSTFLQNQISLELVLSILAETSGWYIRNVTAQEPKKHFSL